MAQPSWRNFILGAAGLAVAIQLIPYGWNHSNPPVVREPAWDRPETRALAVRACFDCHSNTTRWPWYSRLAPASWLVQYDVNQGREHLNLSEWQRPQRHATDAADQVRRGAMPPAPYTAMHPDARLTDVEVADLIQGLSRTLGESDVSR